MPEDAHGLLQRFAIVDDGFPIDAEQLARRVFHGSEYLDGLELVAELPRRVLRPRLHVRRVHDQRVAVPESDGVAVPLRNVLTERQLAVEMRDADDVAAAAADEHHD